MVLAFFCIHRKTGKTREREAEGLPRPSELNSRCRSSGEAWATWNVGICGVEGTERRRTELMPSENEACVESGSGLEKEVTSYF